MSQKVQLNKDCFIPFKASTSSYTLPKRFTFPFYYEPHPLSLLAAKELQEYIETQTEWEHNFGLKEGQKGMIIGKMFGVLVVQNQAKELGYLAAFSGKLADSNHHNRFVPPIFDMLTEDSFFSKGIKHINPINDQIKVLETAPDFLEHKQLVAREKLLFEQELKAKKAINKAAKAVRKAKREVGKQNLNSVDFEKLQIELAQESQNTNIELRHFTRNWKARLEQNEQKLQVFLEEIAVLKRERKEKSSALQQELFEKYQFLNKDGVRKNLAEIFLTTPPPAGSGECAAPKLLQYAFLHHLKPIAMAEFWWGQPPKSEVRKHANFYAACRGKCKPILGHMLEGIEMDENPMLKSTALGKKIKTVYEDEHLVVINKPTDLLSVPGINVEDSVLFRMKQKYPNATGPLVVHRLDMSTSGLMLIAKSLGVYKGLQRQFIKRRVKKRYVALLEGLLDQNEGTIELPLRVDLDDRPRQLVCYEHGKSAKTQWKTIEEIDGHTKVYFFPTTGRTHQLRVHAAHPLGLSTAIVGDDLYGKKGKRLHLHAEQIEFRHPITKETMTIQIDAGF